MKKNGLLMWLMKLVVGPICMSPWCVERPAPRCETEQCAPHCDTNCRCGRELSADEKEVIHEMRRFRRAGKN